MAEYKARKVKVPEGYKDESEFITEAVELFQEGVDYDRENREQGVDDLKFMAGEHWSQQDLDARDGKPCLTINKFPAFIAQVTGDIRSSPPGIRVRPVEDADKDLAEIREGLIRTIERDNDAAGIYSQVSQAQTACGIGNFRLGLDYVGFDTFSQDVKMAMIENPFGVVWDPKSVERTGRDARYCFVMDEMPRKAFEKQYKDKMPSDLEVTLNDDKGWFRGDVVRVTEYWRVLDRKVEIALLEDGTVLRASDVPEGVIPLKTRMADEPYVQMYIISGNCILDGPFDYELDRVPIIRVPGWVVNVGPRRVRFGLIRFAKDLARLENYWRSVSAEMLAFAGKAKWVLPENAVGDQDEFIEQVRRDDDVLTFRGAQGPNLVGPPPFNSAVLQESAINAQNIKDVTGIHDASLGVKSNETSGKAIMARQREGDTATYIYVDNLSAAIKEAGRIINQFIPIAYDTPRTIRVLGQDETQKIMKVNDPNDPQSVDINKGRYDIAIETGPSYATKRVEAAESMMAFVQAVPAAAAVSGDLIAKAQDWPMAEKIAERLKKALPPQFQDADEIDPQKGPTPEQQQKMQQDQAAQQSQAMAQEMTQKAAALELAEKEADVLKAQAEAKKAEADAIKAQIEAGIMTGNVVAQTNAFGQGSPLPEPSATGEAFIPA